MLEATRRRRLAVRIGDEIYPLVRRSKRSGMFHEELTIPAERLPQVMREPTGNGSSSLAISLVSSTGKDFGSAAPIQFLPRRGVSVVSDIDDTLKETHVHERHTMLVNTFLREFVPVAGMRELYQRWEKAGAAFHYVSSSPWQLYWPLAKHFIDEELPLGSFHLRSFRLRDHMLRRIFFGRRPIKGIVIRNLMQRFPQRKFVLVGDSGEYDPEIYGSLARRFPKQVSAILIRRVAGQHPAAFRWERAFRKLDRSLWRLFDDPLEIDDAISSESLLNGG
jgi:phosphatidate phosphatase APP1